MRRAAAQSRSSTAMRKRTGMRIYLVRHASHSLLGHVLCGRAIDVGLNPEGRRQACALADCFAHERIDLLQTSPRRRARQTAREIGIATECFSEPVSALDEHDSGDWAGLRFHTLAQDPDWRVWNEQRGSARPPRGETMRDLQQRVVEHLEAIRSEPIASAIMVSHAEPIRAAIMHYRGIALDDFQQVQVEPASVHVLDLTRINAEIRSFNTMAMA
jgi:broad specificity phosphatase PhoE